MITIYIVKNKINDCVYIGQTSKSLENRLNHHFSNIPSGKTKFVKAMKEIGKDNFYIEALEYVDENIADERELYWINYYKIISDVYNTKFSQGKCGGDTLSNHPNYEEISKKISKNISGKNNGNSKKVVARNMKYNFSIGFDSVSECQQFFNIPRHDIITRRCRKIIKKLWRDTYIFEYL